MSKFLPYVHETTSTAGSGGNPMTLLGAQSGRRAFSQEAATGQAEIEFYRYDSTGKYDRGLATLTSATVLTPTLCLGSSVSPVGGPYVFNTWSGTQNVISDVIEAVLARNAGSELVAYAAAFRSNLNLGTSHVEGLSGGTNGKVVRPSTGSTWTDAANTDTAAQLMHLAVKVGGLYYKRPGLITGLSGFVANSHYWLGLAGAFTATPPTPSASVRQVYLGWAPSTTEIFWSPGVPIEG